jgi:hypothetical protein
MDELFELNRSIAEHWLGKLDTDQENYLSLKPVCVGVLPHSAHELAHMLAASKKAHAQSLRVLALNRRYLNFARLAAKDAAAGKLEMLIKFGISLDQAQFLGSLSSEEVALLALAWQGPIVQFAMQSFVEGAAMPLSVAKHHAAASIATAAA